MIKYNADEKIKIIAEDNSLRKDNGHCIVQDTLTEYQCIQINVHIQVIEDRQYSY